MNRHLVKTNSTGYFFLVAASIVVVLTGIKSAVPIVVPFILSVFIAIILTPYYNWLNAKKSPQILSLFIVLLSFVGLLSLMGVLLGTSIQNFSSNLPSYSEQLKIQLAGFFDFLLSVGIEVPEEEITKMLNPAMIMTFAAGTLKSVGSTITNSFVILLMVIFMITEAGDFVKKLANHGRDGSTLSHVEEITAKIKHYMALKTVISLATGTIVTIMLSFFGLDYAFLWGVVAFLFNFIPNIGSIIAAIPAIMLSLIQLGFLETSIIALGYMLINTIIGSMIEPKVMGKGLGLSTLVVFLSLIFWGWILGPVGMLLSIPLTIMAKIALYADENTRFFAELLGPASDLKGR